MTLDRPFSSVVAVSGRTLDGFGMTFESGRITVTCENECNVAGFPSGYSGGLIEPGEFRGATPDGWCLHLRGVRSIGIRSGQIQDATVSPSSMSVWLETMPEGPGEASEYEITVEWLVSHAPVLWEVARQPLSVPAGFLTLIGMDYEKFIDILGTRPGMTLDVSPGTTTAYYSESRDDERVGNLSALERTTRRDARLAFHAVQVASDAAEIHETLRRVSEHTDALLTAISFLGGNRTLWYERRERVRLRGDRARAQPVHRLTEYVFGNFPPTRVRSAVSPQLVRHVIAHAGDGVRGVLEHGEPITASIETYLQALTARDGATQLLLLSTALETLKSAHLDRSGRTSLVNDLAFKRIRKELARSLKAEWRDADGDSTVRSQMSAHLGQLNRPAYRSVIEGMARDLGLELDPSDGDPLAFIPIRNEYVHTGRIADPAALHAALPKLLRLVQGFILLSIGFPQHLMSPARTGGSSVPVGGT